MYIHLLVLPRRNHAKVGAEDGSNLKGDVLIKDNKSQKNINWWERDQLAMVVCTSADEKSLSGNNLEQFQLVGRAGLARELRNAGDEKLLASIKSGFFM